MTRSERLREMERLYTQRAFSDSELAARLGVDRSTVYRDRLTLETEFPFIENTPGHWRIDRNHYLSSIRVSLDEAMALYLPLKRVSRSTRIANPHIANALEKLSLILRQPMTARLAQAAAGLLDQQPQPERITVLETITRAWVESCKVHLYYRSLHAEKAMRYTVSPYLIEPSIWNESAYLIGYCEVHQDITTFKLERIESAELTGERFELPADFDAEVLLRYAWGIWTSDHEPVEVVLRFIPGEAARRLQESIWHPTQQITPTADGGCLWRAQVAEWRELLPWVRGWGADCEALKPKELREMIITESKELADLYASS